MRRCSFHIFHVNLSSAKGQIRFARTRVNDQLGQSDKVASTSGGSGDQAAFTWGVRVGGGQVFAVDSPKSGITSGFDLPGYGHPIVVCPRTIDRASIQVSRQADATDVWNRFAI